MEWIPAYIRGKMDPSTVKFPHPLLEDVCRETYGVMVYQEQVMEAARIIAGYTLGGADMLRRAMGKKDPVAMAQERDKFVAGAKRLHNIDEDTSHAIFDILNKFAGYGFNKSHSAAYAILSYQTAYLKANYPVQFMAAVLSSELGNADKVSHFIAEALAMGIPVLGPDVNESRESFTPVVGAARAPAPPSVAHGDGGPPSRRQDPIRARRHQGRGRSRRAKEHQRARGRRAVPGFAEFLLRVDIRAINKRVLENLVAAGAFDFSGAAREGLFAQIDEVLAALGELQRRYPALRREPADALRPAEPSETMLFDLTDTAAAAPPELDVLAGEFAELIRHTHRARRERAGRRRAGRGSRHAGSRGRRAGPRLRAMAPRPCRRARRSGG